MDGKFDLTSFETVTMYPQDEAQHLNPLFDKYIESTLSFKNSNCKELIPVTELNGVISLCRLYDSLATSDNGVCKTHLTLNRFYLKSLTPLIILLLILLTVLIIATTTAAVIIA